MAEKIFIKVVETIGKVTRSKQVPLIDIVSKMVSDSGLIRLKTGIYTGNGTTSQAIIGIGFSPKYVKIFEKQTNSGNNVQMFETTSEIMNDHVDGGAIRSGANSVEHEFRKDAIISLDADGFTVDDNNADYHPNQNLKEYNYIAFG